MVKIILSAIFVLAVMQTKAQTEPTGKLQATTLNSFNYVVDGVKMPYTVKVEENREYHKNLNDQINAMDRSQGSIPAKVAKLITITNEAKPEDNKVISLKYDKQITDSFKLVSTDKGFAVNVDDKTMEYIMGTGIYFANTADKDFFIIDKFETKN